jgi:acyl carrier protein
MKDEILNIINDILTTNEKPSLDKIDGDASLTDDIGLDSLDLAQLTVMVEDKYGIDIFEDQIITHVKQIFDKISH